MAGVRVCYYCGVLADTVDHVVPRHLLERAGAAGISLAAVYRVRLWEVPACRECNCLIGGAIFKTIKERVAYVKMRIRKRYSRLLRMPQWTEEELEEVGPGMRGFVANAQARRQYIRDRLAWRPSAAFAPDVSAVYDLFRLTVLDDARGSPTGNDASPEEADHRLDRDT